MPPQEQAQVVPALIMDGEIRLTFFTLTQDRTTQVQTVATQAQAIASKTNRVVGPRVK